MIDQKCKLKHFRKCASCFNSRKYLMHFTCMFFALMFIACNNTFIYHLTYEGDRCLKTEVSRKYLKKGVFVDVTVETLDNGVKNISQDTFKVKQDVWYRYCCGKWRKYFDKNDYKEDKLVVQCSYDCSLDYTRIPSGLDTINGHIVYRFRSIGNEYNYFAPTIFFDPAVGMVKMISPTLRCDTLMLSTYVKGRKNRLY